VSYSLALKRLPIVDVMVIGGLFTLRLWFGAVLVSAPLKPWLFVFSAFLFTSLAVAKRAAEIGRLRADGSEQIGGRGYRAVDALMVSALGVSSSVAAILVMVLYLIDEALVQPFYRWPQALFVVPVALTLWLGRIWLLCGRDELDDDPVAFAVRDKASLALAALTAAAMAAAVLL
jgi:4-hydroxybenzoate polyprenyltransferase